MRPTSKDWVKSVLVDQLTLSSATCFFTEGPQLVQFSVVVLLVEGETADNVAQTTSDDQ